MSEMTFGSLFSGIGGIDLGLERAGMTCLWQSEIDPYASAVLKKHWPGVPNLGDIRTIRAFRQVPAVDLICGGVPCQPWSVAGKRRGNDDDRDLWPEFWRVCLLVRPRYILVEEVPGFAVDGGLGRALTDLAGAGFDAEWFHLSAADVGAPHLRRRLFLVAYASEHELRDESGRRDGARGACASLPGVDGEEQPLAYANGERQPQRCERDGEPIQPGQQAPRRSDARGCRQDVADSDEPGLALWQGEPSRWFPEPDVGRVANGVPSRVDRLRCLGNAVVPACAEAIGRMILASIK